LLLQARILLTDQEEYNMQRQDVHILKSMMRGNICSPYSSTALKALVERAIKLPLIYMGDRELNTDEVLNFKPSEGDPPALMQEGSYDEFILMLTMANYTHPDVEHMSPEMREQYRSEEGDVDIWCYINNNPYASVEYIKDGIGGNMALRFDSKELGAVGNRGEVDTSAVEAKDISRMQDYLTKDGADLSKTRFSTLTLIAHLEGGGYEWGGVVTESVNEHNHFTVEPVEGYNAFYERYGKDMQQAPKKGLVVENMNEEFQRTGVTVVRAMSCLNNYLKYGEKHLVEVLPAKPKKRRGNTLTKTRPWLNATGPHVLLLDRMPTTQKEHQGGTHASPKPHRRRGHWKRLQHPKYRHHPSYQKQIYVKPSFVGPKEVTYEGNIYRLVEPLEDIIQ
jgi:hypothetical protein